jgi:hypothetical protein
MALQTREVQAAKTTAARKVGQRIGERIFRNRRPLGVLATGAITVAGYLATGALRPDIALLFITGTSMSNAGNSLELHIKLENAGYKHTSITMLSTGIMDMANMTISFLPFLAWLHKSNDYVKDGFAYLAVLAVTSVAAQAMEKRAHFNLLREKFNSAFSHMGLRGCVDYLRELEKREKSWWRRPYWMVNPGGLQDLQDEKMKVDRYMKDRMQCKSL